MLPDKILNQPYSLLALLLSPWKTKEVQRSLRSILSRPDVNWVGLLYTANLYLCTPLWYVQMQRDGLLDLLPDELQNYLQAMYDQNRERNTVFKKGLKEIVRSFNEQEIPVVLLKGAATFCDDLYEDSGARMMQDLDLLVKPEDLEKAGEIMRALGYSSKDAQDNNAHHLPLFFRPGSEEAVEIHHRTHHGWASAVLPLEKIWNGVLPAMLDEISVNILPPVQRLLHNATHGLVAHHSYVRSNISLLDLVEFSCLTKKYRDAIDWQQWLAASRRVNMATLFSVYIRLAEKLLHLPKVPGLDNGPLTDFHARRIIRAGNAVNCLKPGDRPSVRQSVQRALATVPIKGYYYLTLPGWMWKHASFSADDISLQNKWRFLYHKLTSKKSRENLSF